MDGARHGRWQFTVRSLLLVTVAVALLMVPVVWVARERRQLLRAQQEILLAREVALQSAIREEQRRLSAAASAAENAPSPAGSLEQLRHENVNLKQQLQQLRREVDQLRAPARAAGNPALRKPDRQSAAPPGVASVGSQE